MIATYCYCIFSLIQFVVLIFYFFPIGKVEKCCYSDVNVQIL